LGSSWDFVGNTKNRIGVRGGEEAGMSEGRRRMELVAFTPLRRGTLRGFALVRLPIGLEIADCPVHHHPGGRCWAALPSKPMIDAGGRHVEKGGKRQYIPILKWTDRAVSDRWSDAVVELVREEYPDALDGSGEAAA
jgi:hypothetical protein